MSVPADPPQQDDFEKFFTVFDGSSPEDVSHARQLWSSLSLLPPLESRLVSADIRQRLPVSRPQRTGTTAAPGPKHSAPEPPSVPEPRQRQEDRRRCVAEQRTEVRSRRGCSLRPLKVKVDREKMLKLQKDCEMDQELVRQLQ